MSQYTIIYKYGKRSRQLEFKRELTNFPQETMAAKENRLAPEFNEMEAIELLEDLSNSLVGYLSSHIQRALVE